ncbi:MAG: hypothetical protein ACOY46_06065 [Bacillota bacterium]
MTRVRVLITGAAICMTVALSVFLGAAFMSGILGRPILPVFGQGAVNTVSPGAVLREENCYICGDVELVFQGPASGDIVGKSAKDLRGKYSEKEGWSVGLDSDRLVVLRRSIDGFCGEHSNYRHLGIHRDRLAVYQGPLGYDQRLLRVEENKKLDQLPPSLREKMKKARDYNTLSPEERDVLRAHLEFTDERLLNSALENLDEDVE